MFLPDIATSKNSRQLKEKIQNKKEWKPNENLICNMKYSEQIVYGNNIRYYNKNGTSRNFQKHILEFQECYSIVPRNKKNLNII